MTNWKLIVENISGIRDKREFILKDGINLIIGDNATGKTSLVNAIKLLNNLNLKESSKNLRNSDLTYQDFLNNKTRNAEIKLINEHIEYHLKVSSPAGKITSYLEGNSPLTKNDKKFITDDPKVAKFAFIDKNNNLMESIEYTGTIEKIKDEILKLSNIDSYESILNQVKEINFEYLERKEIEIKNLNDDRKEIELKIQENLSNLEELQQELNEIQLDQEGSDELTNLKEQLEIQNQKYNSLQLKELDSLIQENSKTIAIIDKDKKKLKNLKNKKTELENFVELESSIVENEKIIEEFDFDLKEFKEKKDTLNRKRLYMLQQIQFLTETVKNGEEDIICHHCLNPINLKKIKEKLEELELNKRSTLDNMRNIESEIQNKSKQRNKISNLISDQKNIPTRLSNLNSEINSLIKKISVNEEKKNRQVSNIEIKNQQLHQIQKEIEKFQKKIIEHSAQNDDFKQKYTEVITKINYIKEENNKLASKKNLLVQKILILPENYNSLIKRTEILINILNSHVEKFYFEFIDNINKELEVLLGKLEWNFQEVFIDDALNLIIKNSEGKPQKFNTLSDFEKKSIAILILLIIKMEYYPNYPIFVIDEHLNSADSERFIKFVPHLYEKIIKSNIKLFIITSLPNYPELEFISDWENRKYEELTIFYKC